MLRVRNWVSENWWHETGNLWWGCTEVHRGCDNCYARTWSKRYQVAEWGNDSPRVAVKSAFRNFRKWQKEAAAANTIKRIFVGSMMDIFEKDQPLVNRDGTKHEAGTTGVLRERLFREVIPNSPNLRFLLLTKRVTNVYRMIPDDWRYDPPNNVMIGGSIVDEATLWTVGRHLAGLRLLGFRTFWSVEPLLEGIRIYEKEGEFAIRHINNPRVYAEGYVPDWVICGGESGPKRREFRAEWAAPLLSWCDDNNVPFFMKQMDKVREIPTALRVREYPEFIDESIFQA